MNKELNKEMESNTKNFEDLVPSSMKFTADGGLKRYDYISMVISHPNSDNRILGTIDKDHFSKLLSWLGFKPYNANRVLDNSYEYGVCIFTYDENPRTSSRPEWSIDVYPVYNEGGGVRMHHDNAPIRFDEMKMLKYMRQVSKHNKIHTWITPK